ncbi:MAG: hypothetical protein ABSC14_10190, partial [Desulfomonilia bacterium]
VPAWCGASPAFWDAAKSELGLDDEGLRVRLGDDFRRVSARYAGPDLGLSPGATWKSPFGIERTGIGYGQPLSHPLAHASSVKDILDYPWPDPDWMDVSHVRAEAERYAGQYAMLGGDWSPFWHDAIDFMSLDRLYFLMYDHPDAAEALFQSAGFRGCTGASGCLPYGYTDRSRGEPAGKGGYCIFNVHEIHPGGISGNKLEDIVRAEKDIPKNRKDDSFRRQGYGGFCKNHQQRPLYH